MKYSIAALFLFPAVLNAMPSLAREPKFNEVQRCVISTDPFAVPAYIPGLLPGEGRNGPVTRPVLKPSDAGQCVAQNEYRPVMHLTESEAIQYNFTPANNTIEVANVRGFDNWYTASIPYTSATHANFLVSIRRMPVLGVRGGHAELRIFFSKPVVLTPQWPFAPMQRMETHELIFTANPTGFNGPSRYDPVKNFDGSLLNARGIQTRESRIKQSFIDSHTFTEKQYQLNLEPWEIANYIKLYINLATETRLSQRFILTARNCDSTQFEVLDAVLGHRYHMQQFPFDPEFAKPRLEERKLISEAGETIPFEEEQFAKDLFSQYGRADEH